MRYFKEEEMEGWTVYCGGGVLDVVEVGVGGWAASCLGGWLVA